MKKQQPNRQRTSRGASFKRIAKGIRKKGRESRNPVLLAFARDVARVFDDEAKVLRSHR